MSMFWPHQEQTIAQGLETQVGLDLSDPGTGKTRSHLGIYARRPTRGRLLVVCPKTLMRSAWGEEVATAFPQFGVVYSDAGKQRIEALRSFAEIVVINIDGVKELLANKEALKILSTQFDHLIIDEISYYKHGTSKRTKAMIKLAKLFKWRFGLTGTPTPNSVTELWAPMMIIDGGVRLGTSFFGFRNTMQTATQVGPRSEHVRWDDNPGAANVVFHLINDIAVRHSFEEVMTHVPPNHRSVVQFDLSPKARKAYKQMEDQAEAELDSGTISAVHASSLRTKLLQICCIEGGTDVLTDIGWKPIESVTTTDKVWNGSEWAQSEGSTCSGYTSVIDCDGVGMTPDHKVLTVSGWATAQEIADGHADGRFDRTPIWPFNGYQADSENSVRNMALADAVRLRKTSNAHRSEPEKHKPLGKKVLRVQPRSSTCGASEIARNGIHAAVQPVGENSLALQSADGQGLQELRGARNQSLQSLERLCELRSGHGADVQAGANTGSEEQRRTVFAKELSMGYGDGAKQQHPRERTCSDAKRHDDDFAGSKDIRLETDHGVQATRTGRYRNAPSAAGDVAVYDIVNVQPGNCFTVRGKTGKVFVVHNSGAVYANPDQYGVVDTQRYELICDLIEERKHSVTFFRWKHQRDQLADMLDKRNVRFAIIDGNTPDREREDIVTAYQAGKYQTILLHPQTGAHGLTLTRGTTTILCSPIYEADLMKQALHRIYRGTQNQVTNTILVCARDTVEEYVYGRLDQKTEHMNDFLEMVRASKDAR